jgi:hypothetical protein
VLIGAIHFWFDHNNVGYVDEVTDAIYAALGVVYAVLLAQLVVTAWSDYEELQHATFREAAALKDLVRLARGFPDAERGAIRGAVAEYAGFVVDVEWPEMANGVHRHLAGEALIDRRFQLYAEADRGPARGSPFLDASLDELDEFVDARGMRRTAVRWNVHRTLWAAMGIEGGIVIGFVAFFSDADDMRAHVVLVMVLLVAIIAMLAVVAVLERPFRWPARIDPSDFEEARALCGET